MVEATAVKHSVLEVFEVELLEAEPVYELPDAGVKTAAKQ